MTPIDNYSLRKIDDDSLTIVRKKYKNGYRFYNENGAHIQSKALLKRLKSLVIPPMWTEVNVCKWDDGHIQATGRDLKGRKQYIYHSLWEKMRQEAKFAKMAKFGIYLPKIRKQAANDLSKKKWTKRKVSALLIMILDETGIT